MAVVAPKVCPPGVSGRPPSGDSARSLLGGAWRYVFQVAPLPHATGSASALISAGLLNAGAELLAESVLLGVLALAPGIGWSGLALLCFVDGYSRYREYRRLKRVFGRRGYCPRLLRPLAASRCQRDAAVQAAREVGRGKCARDYFRSLGCRWFHLMPDKVVRNPLHFFSPEFLRVTFVPTRK